MAYCSTNRTVTYDSASYKYLIKYDGKTIEATVTNKAAVAQEWVKQIMSVYANTSKMVVGLDVEWRPHHLRHLRLSNKSATLQLCIGTKCLILQLFYMDSIPQSLKSFLMNPKFVFVGVEVEDDIAKLNNEYGLNCAKSADVRAEVVKKWPMKYYRKPGLKHLARDFVGLHMEKPMDVCLSNWEATVLSEAQVEYACIDAYASFKVGHKLFLES